MNDSSLCPKCGRGCKVDESVCGFCGENLNSAALFKLPYDGFEAKEAFRNIAIIQIVMLTLSVIIIVLGFIFCNLCGDRELLAFDGFMYAMSPLPVIAFSTSSLVMAIHATKSRMEQFEDKRRATGLRVIAIITFCVSFISWVTAIHPFFLEELWSDIPELYNLAFAFLILSPILTAVGLVNMIIVIMQVVEIRGAKVIIK